MNQVRVFSYGGGVQSNAVLALQALGKLTVPYDVFVFANVGADSENPDTLEYVESVAKPFAERHGIKFLEIHKTRRDGTQETLADRIFADNRTVPIPAYMSGGAPGNRSCTTDFKIRVIDRWIKQSKFTHAVIGLGISIDEFQRMRGEEWHDMNGKKKLGFMKRREHPLIDLRMNRKDCKALILDAGLPVPPKSSCFFCPFRKRSEWVELKRDQPELFEKAVAIEQAINDKRNSMGKDRLYLHPSLRPLAETVADQPLLFSADEMDMCESGYCMV